MPWGTGPTPGLPPAPLHLISLPHHAPCPHSPWGIGSLGLSLDGGPRAPQEGLGSGAHAIVVVAVERGAVARGWERTMAPRGGSTPRGAQVVDPAGAGDHWLPVGVGGRTGWSRDVREAAVEKGGSSVPTRTPALPGPALAGHCADCRGLSHWERMLSEAGPWHTSQVRGGCQRGWGWDRGCPRATHRSEASSLLMYSSRMLVSMLEGSRAPLMSWPVGEGQM